MFVLRCKDNFCQLLAQQNLKEQVPMLVLNPGKHTSRTFTFVWWEWVFLNLWGHCCCIYYWVATKGNHLCLDYVTCFSPLAKGDLRYMVIGKLASVSKYFTSNNPTQSEADMRQLNLNSSVPREKRWCHFWQKGWTTWFTLYTWMSFHR